jgi:hypothetical protein
MCGNARSFFPNFSTSKAAKFCEDFDTTDGLARIDRRQVGERISGTAPAYLGVDQNFFVNCPVAVLV